MGFIQPMLADTMPGSDHKDRSLRWSVFKIEPGQYAVEQKLDGHRLIISVEEGIIDPQSLFDPPSHPAKLVRAWSRDFISRALPKHIVTAMSTFPAGVYDGELLVPGRRSYGVTELTQSQNLVFMVFDIPELLHQSTTKQTYDYRRALLEEMFNREEIKLWAKAVQLVPSLNIDSMDEVRRVCEYVWTQDGEGVIVKRRDSLYHPGKRPKDNWWKIKDLLSAVFEVVGFEPSRGTKNNRGPYGMTKLRDAEGHFTQVKTKNDAECRRLEHAAMSPEAVSLGHHPDLGRMLRCSYQERTPDFSYRHIRWDRWENQ